MENGMPNFCIKCNRELSDKEKAMGIPICQSCVGSLAEVTEKKLSGVDIKKISDKVDNFSRFISSSGHLMELDDVLISQCCFNIFMKSVVNVENTDIILAGKILEQAIVFMNKELEEIKLKKEKSENPNDQLRLFMEEIMNKGRKNNGGKSSKKDERINEDEKVADDKIIDVEPRPEGRGLRPRVKKVDVR